MVCAPSSLLLAAALACALTDAAPLLSNPETPLGTISLLNHENPAFGGRPSPDMVKPIVPALDSNTTLSRAEVAEVVARGGNTTAAHRKLEVTSTDVARLQQHFGVAMETNVYTLHQKYASAGYTPVPWPSGYWPTYLDSINYRWTNEASPAEKYAKAFGLDPKKFTDNVSTQLGVNSQADSGRVCTVDNQCDRFRDGSKCARRDGAASGYCVPTWYGICHAWAPAAILEAEPRCKVVRNGVTFNPFDIKGLMTAVYDGANVPIVFTGARYDDAGSARDEYGRYTDARERDLGPGFFHIAVTNIMGRFGKSFVVDVNADAQVWNQPVRGYKLSEPQIMTPSVAAQFFFNVPQYPFNKDAKSIAYVEMAFRYINEWNEDGPLVSTGIVDKATVTRTYQYLLELDANQNIIGGEWVYGSQTDHPDFLWFNTEKPKADTVTALGLSYKNVLELLQQSATCGSSTPTTAPPTTAPPTTAPPPASGSQCGNDQTGPKPCPNGEYCQPWNPSFYQCRRLDAKCGKQEVGVDFYGDDLATHQLLLPEDCCDKCIATPGCKAYTFANYNSDGKAYCYLKKGSGTRASKVGLVSALISSSSTTPTTAPPTTAPPTTAPPPASGNPCGNDQTGPLSCPSGEYCQPWNPSFYQCRRLNAKCGKQETGVDFYGADIATHQLLLPEDCCDKCHATAGCKAYTFINYNSDGKAYCYLKTGAGSRTKKVGAVSASIGARL